MSETLRDKTLAGQPPAVREQLLVAAASSGVTDPNDPGWFIVAAVFVAQASAQAAGDAAAATASSVASIKDEIYQGAAKAAADVKSTIETSITGTVNAAISSAAQAGANVLRQAAADLPKVGRENQNAIVDEWKAALANEARRHTWAGLFQNLSVSIALAALLIGGVFVGGMAAGGGGMEAIIRAQHRLVPAGWVLEVGTDGKPLCGPLAGHDVCLARKASRP
ncbi:hypothetical protein A9R16_006845 [Acidiferrobacter thiooxydans]|jgi:hypothetical protein|uniref:hypothetical protein n=1 Tax=Acidiferrobacter thiooxydans TaxID=163359 RepID=UPI00082502D9|nr:hypothetical protein [Acidiferrobacter thiooxydans]UEO01106.1 hypothetical protein A9R16_006845 [Acidiferrobacter thiooxydans]